MGAGSNSKMLSEKWRDDPPGIDNWHDTVSENAARSLVTDISASIDQHFDTKAIRFIILGNSSTGKSALVNLINTAITQKYAHVVVEAGIPSQATKEYREIPIRFESNKDDEEVSGWSLPFLLCDFLGFGTAKHGASMSSVERAIEGSIETRELVQPGERNTEKEPQTRLDSTKPACAVLIVIDQDTLTAMREDSEMKRESPIKDSIKMAVAKSVPVSVIVTKCDRVCPFVHKDVANMHFSPRIRDLVTKTSETLGIPANRVFPVRNYSGVNAMEYKPAMAIQILEPLYYLLLDLYQQLKLLKHERERLENREAPV